MSIERTELANRHYEDVIARFAREVEQAAEKALRELRAEQEGLTLHGKKVVVERDPECPPGQSYLVNGRWQLP